MAPLDNRQGTYKEPAPAKSPHRRGRRWLVALGIFIAAIVVLISVWDWNWFRPFVEARASAALGRKVTIQHLGLHLGWKPQIVLDGVTVANPDGFPADTKFATADRLAVTLDAMAYLRHRQIVVPAIAITKPVVDAEQRADGSATWDFPSLTGGAKSSGPPPKIGDLQITDGQAHVVIPKLKADFQLAIATQAGGDQSAGAASSGSQIVVDAHGTYSNQPITGHLVGGAVLSLRDKATPYPIDMQLANGPTHVKLAGTVDDPLSFAGAHIKLDLNGPDMALLLPLSGVALPKTPSYDVAGDLDYADKRIRLQNIAGRIGSSDLEGRLSVDPGPQRPVLEADLTSRKVDLADIGGFIGSEPGRQGTPNQTPEQKQAVARAEASPQLLPTKRIDLPKLKAMNVHLKYHAGSIAGRSVPLDNLTATLAIDDGRIHLAPLQVAVGRGQIAADIAVTPTTGSDFHTKADVKMQKVDIGRLLAATHAVNGGGVIGGEASLESDGNSAATIVGQGNGELKLFTAGGNLSALLVDLAGLEFGNAVLSALGVPRRADLQCFVADFALRHGVLDTRTLIVDTSEAVITGAGHVDLGRETLDMTLNTKAKHFTIGSIPTPINIGGRLKSPSIRPAIGPLAVRGGAAVGLGILFPPAALLATIQLGVGNDTGCTQAARKDGAQAAAASANAGAAPNANAVSSKGKVVPKKPK